MIGHVDDDGTPFPEKDIDYRFTEKHRKTKEVTPCNYFLVFLFPSPFIYPFPLVFLAILLLSSWLLIFQFFPFRFRKKASLRFLIPWDCFYFLFELISSDHLYLKILYCVFNIFYTPGKSLTNSWLTSPKCCRTSSVPSHMVVS